MNLLKLMTVRHYLRSVRNSGRRRLGRWPSGAKRAASAHRSWNVDSLPIFGSQKTSHALPYVELTTLLPERTLKMLASTASLRLGWAQARESTLHFRYTPFRRVEPRSAAGDRAHIS